MMKKLLLLLLAVAALPAHSQWVEQNSGVSLPLNDVYCIAADSVVVVGSSGTILKTTNGGQSWVAKPSGTTVDLQKVQFITHLIGYAVGSGGKLIKTIDAGETWLSIDTGTTANLYGLSCLSEDIFFVLTSSGIIKTNNGGMTFQVVGTPGNNDVEHIQFVNEETGYASCTENVYRTVDGGTTWTVLATGYYNNAVFFLNANVGWVYGYDGISQTTDGGETFTHVGYNEGGRITGLSAVNDHFLWELNAFETLCMCSYYCVKRREMVEDSESLQIQNCNLTGQELLLSGIHFANESTGYLVSWAGKIFKNTTGTMEVMGVDDFIRHPGYSISPNPASEKVTITLNENPALSYAVSVIDASGKNIHRQSNQTGKSATIPTSSFAKGIYLLTVTSGDKSETQKLIIN